MLDLGDTAAVRFPPEQLPMLIVVVDTEAEFDWTGPIVRRLPTVKNIRSQELAHRVFEKYGVKPTYVVDYPVSSQPEGYLPIREFLRSGLCEIGAHLQPWDNPPFDEVITEVNSYAGNLPAELEREKLRRLADKIEENLGERPRIYKAGRYGLGRSTAKMLSELGFEVDLSVLPGTDLSSECGPDFTALSAEPVWFGEALSLLEIPMSVGFTGLFARRGAALHQFLNKRWAIRCHAPGIFARLRLCDRVTLTPEGVTFEEHRRLTEAMLRAGHRVFSFTYHSPSLAPGHTPYVRTERDLREFLIRIERYIDYFLGYLGGTAITPVALKAVIDSREPSAAQTKKINSFG